MHQSGITQKQMKLYHYSFEKQNGGKHKGNFKLNYTRVLKEMEESAPYMGKYPSLEELKIDVTIFLTNLQTIQQSNFY